MPDQINSNQEEEDLKKILIGLRKTHKELQDIIESKGFVNHIGTQSAPYQSISNATNSIGKMIPSFEEVIGVYKDLKKVIIRPVTKEMKFGSIMTLFGLIISVLSAVLGFFAFQTQENAKVSFEESKVIVDSLKTINYSSADAKAKTRSKIASVLGSASTTDELLKSAKIDIVSVLENTPESSLLNAYDSLFTVLCDDLDTIDLSDADIFKAGIIKIYMDFAKAVYTGNTSPKEVLSNINALLQKELSEIDRLELLWIKSEALKEIGAIEESAKILNSIDIKNVGDSKVIDLQRKSLISIKEIMPKRKISLQQDIIKNNVKVILYNASLFEEKNVAGNKRRLMIRHGFSAKNIITKDHKDKVDKVYAYFRNDNEKDLLLKTVKGLYPNKSNGYFDLTRFDLTENTWIFNKFNEQKDLTFLIRLPGNDTKQ